MTKYQLSRFLLLIPLFKIFGINPTIASVGLVQKNYIEYTETTPINLPNNHFATQVAGLTLPVPNRASPCSTTSGGGRREFIKNITVKAFVKSDCAGQNIRVSEKTKIPSFESADQLLDQGKFQDALTLFTESFDFYKKEKKEVDMADSLNGMGLANDALGHYGKAIENYQQALLIFEKLKNNEGITRTSNLLAKVYYALGEYQQALKLYQVSLEGNDQIYQPILESQILNNIAMVYYQLEEYRKSQDFLEKSLIIAKKQNDQYSIGRILSNIGYVTVALGHPTEALSYFEQSLRIHQERADQTSETSALAGFAFTYLNLQDFSKALDAYSQALVIAREIGNRPGESEILYYMGRAFEADKRLEEAIIFYKISININQDIRHEIKDLSIETQQTYSNLLADRYHRLSNLLLTKDRVLEAQNVLDLLKVQELDNYLRGVRSDTHKVDNLPTEQKVIDEYSQLMDQAVGIGEEIAIIRKIEPSQRTEKQQQRLDELDAQQKQINKLFNGFTRRPDIVAYVEQLDHSGKEQSLDLSNLRQISSNLKDIKSKAVLVYPLILDDRLEIVLATPNSPPIHRTVKVTKAKLNSTILAARQVLSNPRNHDYQPLQQLYDWLIAPIADDLAQAGTESIIYAPDGQLRYIPLAALYDGRQWLVERYNINNITAASLTDFSKPSQDHLSILAGAFTKGNYEIKAGNQDFSLSGLPYAGVEVENLANTVPNTTKLIDQNFSKDATIPKMDDYSIVHFATHAAFVPGNPEDSFIIFGNGDRVTLAEVRDQWFMNHVDLIVLSACDTAVGTKLGNGEEILGFGYLMQNAGARAAIASLWNVDDGGTQALMNEFYRNLSQNKQTKAESLRQAQIALIRNDQNIMLEAQKEFGSLGSFNSKFTNTGYSHPYYWSPFILIGNGL